MSQQQKIIEAFLKAIDTGEIIDLLRNVSMPNIPMKTMGGKTFWNELAECKGWRLQKNMITQHCRILDPEGIRRAWGGDDVMGTPVSKTQQVASAVLRTFASE